MPVNDVINLAMAWRAEYGCVGRGGVILVYDGIPEAWMNQLRNPERWQPGCIAVDEDGKTWTAIAGSERDGALMWLSNEPISD